MEYKGAESEGWRRVLERNESQREDSASGEGMALPFSKITVAALVITLTCYGGWWWTEVLYDSQVIHSRPELHPVPNRADTPVVDGQQAKDHSDGG